MRLIKRREYLPDSSTGYIRPLSVDVRFCSRLYNVRDTIGGTCTVHELIKTAEPILESCRENMSALAKLVPQDQFWRWRETWCMSLRNAIYIASLIEFMKSGTLLTLEQANECLGGIYSCCILGTYS